MATARAKVRDFPKQGKPGYNPQAERNYLYALYDCPDAETFDRWASVTEIEDFDEEKHAALFECLVDLQASGTPRDSVTVNAWLSEHRKLKLWPTWDADLLTDYTGGAHPLKIATYARTVIENGVLRQKRAIGMQVSQDLISAIEAARRLEYLDARTADMGQAKLPQIAGTLMSEVKREAVRWLWRNRLALGKMTITDGDPGEGKGLTTIDIAARWTRGLPMPGETHGREPGNVIMVTPEDDPGDTIRPRLEAAGADLSRVRVMETTKNADGSERIITIPRDVETLEKAIRHDGALLLIIDPIMACFDAGVKTGIDTEVRQALRPLQDMLRRTGCAGWLVRHMNKGNGEKALYRGGGSIGISGACRIATMIGTHPDDIDEDLSPSEVRHVFVGVKCNVGNVADALFFTIVKDAPDATPHISWDPEVHTELKANHLTASRRVARTFGTEQGKVVQFVKDAGKPVSPKEIAEGLGMTDPASNNTLRTMIFRLAKQHVLEPVPGGYIVSKGV